MCEIADLDPLDARHLVEQLHEEPVDAFVAMLFGAGDEIHQSGKGAFVIQQLICSLVHVGMGDQKGGRHQHHVGLVILRIGSAGVCRAGTAPSTHLYQALYELPADVVAVQGEQRRLLELEGAATEIQVGREKAF